MLTTILRAYAPELRDQADERVTIVPRPDNVPLALSDGYGDFRCGHCELVLLRGELPGRAGENRLAEANARELLVRCPSCGWDNAVPRSGFERGAAMHHPHQPGSVAFLLTTLLERRGYPHAYVGGPLTRKITDPDYTVTIYAADGSVVRTMRGSFEQLQEQIRALPKK